MADVDDPKRTWSAWLNRWLGIKGMTQTRFAEASGLNLKTVSKWVNGAAAASADLAVVAARILDAPVVEAMRAAGFPLVAEEMAKGTPETAVDPGIQEILAADLITDEEKAGYIQVYQADLAHAAARARETIRIAQDTRRSAS